MKFKLFLFCLFGSVLSLNAQILKYTNGNNSWNPDLLGNHRVIVLFTGSGTTAHTRVLWRRRDNHPELKQIIIQDEKGSSVKILGTENFSRESADIYFEAPQKGKYFLYYMPFKNDGRSNYPKGTYLRADYSKATVKNTIAVNASPLEIQSIDAFNTFYPMEVITTEKETAALKAKYANEPFVVFPEDRMFPIKMQGDLPYRWIQKGASTSFKGTANRGENYVFQLGVYALKELSDVKVSFGDFKTVSGNVISAKHINCLNTNGTGYDGKPLTNVVNVIKGNVQPLWITVNVPKNTHAGVYKGKVAVKSNGAVKVVDAELTIGNNVLADGGVGTPEKQTRLSWLNSTLAQENTTVAPYTPLKVEGNVISLLGRKFEINPDGFPKQIQTYFNSEMTGYTEKPNNILYEPIHFHFYTSPKTQEKFTPANLQIVSKEDGIVKWVATWTVCNFLSNFAE